MNMCCYTDGDIYGSEGQYIRYEEGAWDSPEAYEEVSSGHPYANPRGRSGSARPSYGADRVSDDDMADGDAYVTPETTAPLQAAAQVSPSPGTPCTHRLLLLLLLLLLLVSFMVKGFSRYGQYLASKTGCVL